MNLRPLVWVGLVAFILVVYSFMLRALPIPNHQPIFRQIPTQHVAYIHHQGPYEDMSLLFSALAKEAKHRINGHAGAIYFPTKPGQKPIYEAYFPIRNDWVPQESAIEFKDIPTANMLIFYHVGSYASLPLTYEKIARFFKDSKIFKKPKSREVYVKGPGCFFKGNPKKYITEIQFEL